MDYRLWLLILFLMPLLAFALRFQQLLLNASSKEFNLLMVLSTVGQDSSSVTFLSLCLPSLLRRLTNSMTPLIPIHKKAGFLLYGQLVFQIRPIDYRTLAMSYNLLIFVFNFCSSMFNLEICRAASSREMTFFHVTKRPINCQQRMPRDLSFLYLLVSSLSESV